jgi:hypothetical protein
MAPAAALVVCTAAIAATAAASASARSDVETPQATEVGVTASEIHVAVIADVDNPLSPNIFKGSKDAVEGAAGFLNSKAGGGGLAGRKVVVDFYDSKLNPNDTTKAQISACQNDVAAVGTSAISLTSVDAMRSCEDSTGEATGLPDIPAVVTALVHQCSDQSFPMAPPQVICSTASQHPQTFQPNVGRGHYYEQRFGDLHGIYVFGNDSKSARDSVFVSGQGQVRLVCCTSDQDFDMSGQATQPQYTPIVLQMRSKGSNFASAASAGAMVLLRKEATLQGLDGVEVWECGVGCYDEEKFLEAGGSDVEGTYVDMRYLPFLSVADREANPMLKNFVKYTGADKANGFGVYAWSAMIAFRDAVNAQVKAGGVNSVTRKTIFEQLNRIHAFDAGGMFGTIDLAGRKTTPCYVLVQVKNGEFQRVLPTKPGTFDCKKDNVKAVKLDVY